MTRAEKVTAIVGITEAIKQYGIPSKYCPTIAIIVGAIFGYADNPNSQGILDGVILGATVTGGYAVVKRSGTAAIQGSSSNKTTETYEHDDYRGV